MKRDIDKDSDQLVTMNTSLMATVVPGLLIVGFGAGFFMTLSVPLGVIGIVFMVVLGVLAASFISSTVMYALALGRYVGGQDIMDIVREYHPEDFEGDGVLKEKEEGL